MQILLQIEEPRMNNYSLINTLPIKMQKNEQNQNNRCLQSQQFLQKLNSKERMAFFSMVGVKTKNAELNFAQKDCLKKQTKPQMFIFNFQCFHFLNTFLF